MVKTAPKEKKTKTAAAKKSEKPIASKAAKAPVKAAPAKKTTAKSRREKVKAGEKYSCEVCGLVVSIDETCGCVDACDIVCCGEEMRAV